MIPKQSFTAKRTLAQGKAMAVRMVELSQPLPPLENLQRYCSVRVFVTWEGMPIGSIDIANDYQPVTSAELASHIAAADLASNREALLHPQKKADQPLSETTLISVIVPTCNRPQDLRNCLQHLIDQQLSQPVEIIVVDNRPDSALTPPVVAEFPGVRLVKEGRPGASYARNTGVSCSRGEIIVTIDDDVTPPPHWLRHLTAPFARPEVMSTTGNILPIELETPAQQIFEIYADGGLGRGFDGFTVDKQWLYSFRRAAPLWQLGATANAAFRASLFRHPEVGLWKEILGAGVPTGGGEDIYLFYEALKAGATHVYEPRAWVWHQHRQELTALRGQIFNYSCGVVAYHLMTLKNHADLRALLTLVLLPVYYLERLVLRLTGRLTYPVSLLGTEILGHLSGPWRLWQSRQHLRKYGKSSLSPAPPQSLETCAPSLSELTTT